MSYNVIKPSHNTGINNVPNDITPDEFEAIAKTCNRWEPRSLTVVRALLIDGRSITDVANEHQMTAQQANVLRTRFMAKLPDYRLSAFKDRVLPKGKPAKATPLQKKAAELETLQSDGYTIDQMIDYLAEYDIKATAPQIRKLLTSAKP